MPYKLAIVDNTTLVCTSLVAIKEVPIAQITRIFLMHERIRVPIGVITCSTGKLWIYRDAHQLQPLIASLLSLNPSIHYCKSILI